MAIFQSVFTGLRPGEKLYEELLIGDNPKATNHPKIYRAHEDFIPWPELRNILLALRDAVNADAYEEVRELLLKTVQGYKPGNEIVDLIWEKRELGVKESR